MDKNRPSFRTKRHDWGEALAAGELGAGLGFGDRQRPAALLGDLLAPAPDPFLL